MNPFLANTNKQPLVIPLGSLRIPLSSADPITYHLFNQNEITQRVTQIKRTNAPPFRRSACKMNSKVIRRMSCLDKINLIIS